MPAHITLLYPFLDQDRFDPETLAELRNTFARQEPIELSFSATGRFPGVLYLEPQPAASLRSLTQALVTRWPDHLPYGGAHADVTPHLTVACADQRTLNEVAEALQPHLPLVATVDRACVYLFDGARWNPRYQLPLGEPKPELPISKPATGGFESWRTLPRHKVSSSVEEILEELRADRL
jgi:2'-5' RNA ligase